MKLVIKIFKKKFCFIEQTVQVELLHCLPFKWIGRERDGGNRKRLVHKEFPLPEQSREIYIYFLSEGFNDTFETEEKKNYLCIFLTQILLNMQFYQLVDGNDTESHDRKNLCVLRLNMMKNLSSCIFFKRFSSNVISSLFVSQLFCISSI